MVSDEASIKRNPFNNIKITLRQTKEMTISIA